MVAVDVLRIYELPELDLDVAFVPYFKLLEESGPELVEEVISAEVVVPMHLGGNDPEARAARRDLAARFPEGILFQEPMEVWALP